MSTTANQPDIFRLITQQEALNASSLLLQSYKAEIAGSMMTDPFPFRAADKRQANYVPNTVKFLLFH